MRALMFIFESINIYFGWFCARSSEPKPIKQGRKTAVKPNPSHGPGSPRKQNMYKHNGVVKQKGVNNYAAA